MKKTLATFAISTFLLGVCLTSCSDTQKNETTLEQTEGESSSEEVVYACTMHPEVTGKDGDKCSKCGMMLVKNTNDSEHNDHEH